MAVDEQKIEMREMCFSSYACVSNQENPNLSID